MSIAIHADFAALPWCQALLNDPSYEYIRTAERFQPGSKEPTFHKLMTKTLATNSTFRAIHYLYKPNSVSSHRPGEPSSSNDAEDSHLVALVSLGSELTSHPSTLHGGICTVLVDEVGGALAMYEVPKGTGMMAVNFNVNLRKSVRVPNVVLCRAWKDVARSGGRKWFVRCTIEQDGVTCIDAECLYLELKTQPKL